MTAGSVTVTQGDWSGPRYVDRGLYPGQHETPSASDGGYVPSTSRDLLHCS